MIVSSIAYKYAEIHWDDLNLKSYWTCFKAYGQSKLANVLHCKELAVRLKDFGIYVYVLHPGKIGKIISYKVNGHNIPRIRRRH